MDKITFLKNDTPYIIIPPCTKGGMMMYGIDVNNGIALAKSQSDHPEPGKLYGVLELTVSTRLLGLDT
jgi:hypothetical protein